MTAIAPAPRAGPSPATTLEAGRRACEVLTELGVTHVFGLPGTQTVPLFEALRRSPLTTVVPTSELSAAFMAGAFFRASGRPAALLTIGGPGFTFALPGLAEARLDSAALLHVTLAVAEDASAPFRLQAIPQRALGDALAKATFHVGGLDELEPALRSAHATAIRGEPGPVIISVARDPDGSPAQRVREAPAAPDHGAIAASWVRLRESRRPLLFVGQGALGARDDVLHLAEALRAPVMTTPGARGLVPEEHDLCIAFDPYRGGNASAEALIRASDLVLVLGAKLGHNGTAGHSLPFDPSRTLQVDAEPSVAGRAYANPAVIARVEEWFAHRLPDALHPREWDPVTVARLRAVIRRPAAFPPEPRVAGGTPATFFAAVRRALPDEAMLVTDTGLHQILTRRHFDVRSARGLLTPSDFQSMGFGLPAAIAARLACPDRAVAAIVGDGSLRINGLELATAAALRLPLPVMVFSDGFLNQIRMHQAAEYGYDSGVALPDLDLAALADATGAAYADGREIEPALREAFRRPGPTLIEVPVEDSVAVRRVRHARRVKETLRQLLRRGVAGWVRRGR